MITLTEHKKVSFLTSIIYGGIMNLFICQKGSKNEQCKRFAISADRDNSYNCLGHCMCTKDQFETTEYPSDCFRDHHAAVLRDERKWVFIFNERIFQVEKFFPLATNVAYTKALSLYIGLKSLEQNGFLSRMDDDTISKIRDPGIFRSLITLRDELNTLEHHELEDHFMASVSVTLQGINPKANLIRVETATD
ncbi:hypothetical protein ACFL08_03540 [Patescibacteria group bacterium]